jgi:hypothetical protein
LNSGVKDRRRRGDCFRSMVSMMNILPPEAEPLMVNVRQNGGSPAPYRSRRAIIQSVVSTSYEQ